MKSLKVRFEGVRPILMHNGQLSDPTNPYAKASKEVSGKKKKTDSDYEKMAKIEWMGGLYTNENKKVVMPGLVIEAAIKSMEKEQKKGKTVDKGLSVFDDAVLDLGREDNKKTIEELWEDGEHKLSVPVVIGRARIIRTRPQFKTWSFECQIDYDEGVLNQGEIESFIKTTYFCDWRPRFGLANGRIIK